MISVLQAQTQILGSPVSLKKEKITSVSSLKRVLAENLICDRATPPFDRATRTALQFVGTRISKIKNSLC